jgi:protein TonB
VAAQRLKVQGRVAVEVLIAKDGSAKTTRAVEGHPQLVRAAEEAVRKWKWDPTTLNGEPVEVISQVVLDFKINPN